MNQKITFFSALRDLVVYLIPSEKLPLWVIKFLYGFSPDFIFLVHPRSIDDMYNTIPFLKMWRNFMPESFIFKFASLWPVGVVADVKWGEKVKGYIISTSMLPQTLFAKRELVSNSIPKIVNFIRKISNGKVYVGLAGWWPIVTNRGLAFKRTLRENDNVVVTNGHTATALSIFLTVKRICKIANMPLEKLNIAILGVGKMGKAIIKLLNGKVDAIGLFDTNKIWLDIAEEKAKQGAGSSKIKKHVVVGKRLDKNAISDFCEYHIVICTTSNVEPIVEDKNALKNILIIDDSRPEAFPRVVNIDKKVLILEGGLVKLKGIKMGADFGFDKEDNVFGCMAEAIVLALDKEQKVKSVLGDIDFKNFEEMATFFSENDISEGDLKSGKQIVDDNVLRKVLS